MPQQFTTVDGADSQLSGQPPATSVPQTRYNRATVERAIRLASEMQTAHRDTMTREQAEAIGEEIGVDPAFVRQAFAQIEADASNVTPTRPDALTARRLTRKNAARRRPTRRRFITATALTALGYGLLSFSVYASASPSALGSVITPLLFIFPFVTAALVGAGGGGKRRGAAGGFAVVFCAVLGSLIAARVINGYHWQGADLPILSVLLGGGLVAGGVGALLRQSVDAYLSGEERDETTPPLVKSEIA